MKFNSLELIGLAAFIVSTTALPHQATQVSAAVVDVKVAAGSLSSSLDGSETSPPPPEASIDPASSISAPPLSSSPGGPQGDSGLSNPNAVPSTAPSGNPTPPTTDTTGAIAAAGDSSIPGSSPPPPNSSGSSSPPASNAALAPSPNSISIQFNGPNPSEGAQYTLSVPLDGSPVQTNNALSISTLISTFASLPKNCQFSYVNQHAALASIATNTWAVGPPQSINSVSCHA